MVMNPGIRRDDITGLILAGGQGSRMGGVDKGLQDLRGQPLVAWSIAALAPQVGSLLLSANRNTQRYAAFGYPVIADLPAADQEAYAGPLAGLIAGLRLCPTPWLVSVPCDVPQLPADLVVRLADAACAQASQLAVACSGERSHPVIALLHRDLLPGLCDYFASGRRSVYGWQQNLPHATVDFGAAALLNCNTLDDLLTLASSDRR